VCSGHCDARQELLEAPPFHLLDFDLYLLFLFSNQIKLYKLKNFVKRGIPQNLVPHTAFSLLEKFTAETDAEDPLLDHGWSLESIFVVRHSILRPSINRSLLCPLPSTPSPGFLPSCTAWPHGGESSQLSDRTCV
jgi:hypothetical protein